MRPGSAPDGTGDLAAELVVVPDAVTVSQQGVLVVPLELRNLGASLVVERAQAFAEPVRLDAEVQFPPALAEAETRRLVALLAPDCRLLRVQTGLTFSQRPRPGGGLGWPRRAARLGADPVVAERVAGLCGQVGVRG